MKTPTWGLHLPAARQRSTVHTGILGRLFSLAALQRVVSLAAIAALVFVAMLQLRTPSAAPVTAPETAFSADRAMIHLNVIASSSRAIGMPGHDAARDYLVNQLTQMGLTPQLQTTTGLVRFEGADAYNAGTVTNVIARIPGTGSSGAIALNAHYDGGSTGPAASDNGSGVVTVLETVRALLASPPLANDVIIVFTDGEENGDIGSAAFNQQHPWAKDVRLAINYEAQGSGGPAILYATSDNNGALTSTYFSVAPKPTAYSLLPELVQKLPGMRLACDLEDYLLNGDAGLGFVYASDTPAYHTARDSVATIDRGSIQQEGENTLAIVRHFGNEDLKSLPVESNRVFFNVLPNVVVHYSDTLAYVFAAIATLAVVVVIVAGFRRGMLSIGGMAVGAAGFLLGTLATVALAMLLWIGLRALNANDQVLLVGTYQTVVNIVGLTLVAVALMAAISIALQRWVRWERLMAGAAVIWTLLLWGATLALPGLSYLLLWPLVFGMLPLSWAVFMRNEESWPWARLAVLVVALIPAIVLLPGTAYQVVSLLNRLEYLMTLTGGFPILGLWALFVAPLVALAIPQIRYFSSTQSRLGRWAVPLTTMLAALVAFGWGMATSSFDADHPRPDTIAYVLDADAGTAQWVSVDPALDDWTRQFFPNGSTRDKYEISPGVKVPALVTPAPVVSLAPVDLRIIRDTTVDSIRTVTLHIDSPRQAAQLDVDVSGATEITAAAINGKSLDLAGYDPAGEGKLTFGYAGITRDGVDVTLAVRSDGPLTIKVSELDYGLPAVPGLAVQPRSAGFMPATGIPLDATSIRRTFKI